MTDVDSTIDVTAATQEPTSQGDAQESNINDFSLIDPNLSKRPRDAHTIHTILHKYGVTAYQERVPLQLMDFAYRYTSGILQDALHLTNEGYGTAGPGIGTSSGGGKSNAEGSTVNISAFRLAINSRTHYQYAPDLPKDYYMDIMQVKNRIALPTMSKEPGIKLPPEQYMLTGQHWEMGEEFDLMDTDGLDHGELTNSSQTVGEEGEGGDEIEGGTMEDIFGPDGGADVDEGMRED